MGLASSTLRYFRNTQMEDTKVTFLIPKDLLEEIREVIPWGQRRHLVTALLQIACEAARRDGNIALGAIIDRQYTLRVKTEHINAAS